MAKTNVTKPNADNDAEKLDHLCIVSGNAKMVQFLIELNINYNTTQKLYHWALISEKRKLTFTQKPINIYFIVTLCVISPNRMFELKISWSL